ncbi:MAG: bifunctional hydroxymethylpyrimidine kinase/phosphomethylpyrimidine kinase, partial [Betaproteobacteria bacterium]|nr:bifunctional hydroxymethylpyrimidine kinase/phosphomethylpyrimidine kinase [Betaproteobacteria bacterium]
MFAGSDSSGGAGIAADLAAVRALGGQPRLVITAITAQTSQDGLLAVQPTSAQLLAAQFASACREDSGEMADATVKVGMLADADSIRTVAGLLAGFAGLRIVDPVCGPTAGGNWADTAWRRAFMQEMPDACDLITPNLSEARFLADLCESAAPAEAGSALLAAGFAQVLITDAAPDNQDVVKDMLFSADADANFIATGRRFGTGRRGSGCTLSSAIAAAGTGDKCPAFLPLAEEIIVGKMQSASHCQGSKSPAADPQLLPQVEAGWIDNSGCDFLPLEEPLGVCPITDDPVRIGDFARQGFTSAQLRIKNQSPGQIAAACAAAAAATGGRLRLFINDHWQVAAATDGVYGVHLGQQDLGRADLELIAAKRLRLGVSAHGFFELALA